MSNPDNRRCTIGWEEVAVTALPPGWRNVYREEGALIERPCPAVLIQENRGVHVSWDEPGTDAPLTRRTRFDAAEPPYETRTVFADLDFGHLEAAADAPNYVVTAAPGQTAEEAEKTNS
jgi:hypothetical protein